MTLAHPIAGIDISSTTLDVAVLHADGAFKASSAANSKPAARKLARQLASSGVRLVVIEATGGYELIIMAALAGEGVPVARVNPRQAGISPRASAGWPKPIPSMPACWPPSASGPGRASPPCRAHKRPG